MEFFTKNKKEEIKCIACAKSCEILNGGVGYCGVRRNDSGVLCLLNYGRLTFLKMDDSSLEKRMLVGSVGSNMRMSFDPNWDTSLFPYLRSKEVGRQKANEEIKSIGYAYSPLELVNYVKKQECGEIVFQFNEPLIYIEYVLDVSKLCKKENIKISIVTTGYFSQESLEQVLNCVDKVSIYLFSTFDKFYIKHCDAQLSVIKKNIKSVFKSGISLKILCPLIPGENDSEKNIENISKFLFDISSEIPLTFVKFLPSFRMLDKALTSRAKLEQGVEIAKKTGLKNVDFIS